jgi:hypothetical protein
LRLREKASAAFQPLSVFFPFFFSAVRVKVMSLSTVHERGIDPEGVRRVRRPGGHFAPEFEPLAELVIHERFVGDVALDGLLEILLEELVEKGVPELDAQVQKRDREKDVVLSRLVDEDLGEGAGGDVFARPGVDHLDALPLLDPVGHPGQGHVCVFLRVVKTAVAVFPYGYGLGHSGLSVRGIPIAARFPRLGDASLQ